MNTIKHAFLLTLIILLTACNNQAIQPFQDAIDEFYYTQAYGFDLTIEQFYQEERINYELIEMRIHKNEFLQSYTWIQEKTLLTFKEQPFRYEETIIYFQEPNQVFIETNTHIETHNMTYDQYLLLAQPYSFNLQSYYFETYTIDGENTISFCGYINVQHLSSFMGVDMTDVEQAKLNIIIESGNLITLELTITLKLTTIQIKLTPNYQNTRIIMPIKE